jgi:hypothetical protein
MFKDQTIAVILSIIGAAIIAPLIVKWIKAFRKKK